MRFLIACVVTAVSVFQAYLEFNLNEGVVIEADGCSQRGFGLPCVAYDIDLEERQAVSSVQLEKHVNWILIHYVVSRSLHGGKSSILVVGKKV